MTGRISLYKINTDISRIKRSNYNKLHSCSESWLWYDYWREKQTSECFMSSFVKMYTLVHMLKYSPLTSIPFSGETIWGQTSVSCNLWLLWVYFLNVKKSPLNKTNKKAWNEVPVGWKLAWVIFHPIKNRNNNILYNNIYIYTYKIIKVVPVSIILQNFCITICF